MATGQPPYTNPGHSGPTTFFLRNERDIEAAAAAQQQQVRGRKMSRASGSAQERDIHKIPSSSTMSEAEFGVQSLEETISDPFAADPRSLSRPNDNTLSRTDSNMSDASADAGAEASILSRKRKAGNPVHPRIAAAGQRIISADYASPTQGPRAGSPVSLRSIDSPVHSRLRRGSAASSINLSQPLTPLRLSPQPASAMPSTPRSGSPKSFRLSDEETSVTSETHSQALQSSSGEEDDERADDAALGVMPQLVMPSIAMPARRPFTEAGQRIGRLKIIVVGARGIGKTSLIKSMCRTCEDVVHVDSMPSNVQHMPPGVICDDRPCTGHPKFEEIGASTRPYPAWWTDFQSRRMLLERKSVGEGVLERNITFIDTPGFRDDIDVQQMLTYFKTSLSRMTTMGKMGDSELVGMLSGEGGLQIDAVIYLFDPSVTAEDAPVLGQTEVDLVRYLCKWTNVIPVIGRTDEVDAAELESRKQQLIKTFESLDARPYLEELLPSSSDEVTLPTPFAISSALSDDSETIDASVLMASTYLQPLIPSELESFVAALFDPNNTARLRHLSATKFLLWRQVNLGFHLQNQLLLAPGVAASTDQISDEHSHALVPHRSPAASPTLEPFRQLRLAKWAQDLQRGLYNERRQYQRMYTGSSSHSGAEDEKSPTLPLATTTANDSGYYASARPQKGRLGGPVSIIDPRDPLGLLALAQLSRRRGYVALQLAAGCGVVGVVVWWVLRNWADVQEWVGLGSLRGASGEESLWSVTAVPAPTTTADRGWWDGLTEMVGLRI